MQAKAKPADFGELEISLRDRQLRAYLRTQHAHCALDEFSHLDPARARDQRVLRREGMTHA